MEDIKLVGIDETNPERQLWKIGSTELGPLVVIYDGERLGEPILFNELIRFDPYWRPPTHQEIEGIELPIDLRFC